ncbi:MAG: M23 family metallopeptidase [Clostridia bacterium]|nr:M23 family metallopeptidase [Clostridia bacterium]
MSDSANKKKDPFFTVLVVQSLLSVLLIGVMLYSFYNSGEFYKTIVEGYESYMTEEYEPEDIAEAFMKMNEYADVFAPEETSSVKPAGGEDIVFTSIDALEGICFEKVDTGVNMQMPLDDYTVSSEFGYRIGPITGEAGIHTGLDLAADYGTGIKAAAAGEVVDASWDKSYGNYVKILHDNNTVSIYAHCSSLCAQEGDRVKTGDVIAFVGSTGDSTGNHLHFEIRKDNIRINPSFYVEI